MPESAHNDIAPLIMATLEELYSAFIKADDAGNVQDAKIFANEIRRMRAEENLKTSSPSIGQSSKSDVTLLPPLVTAGASSLIGIATTWAIIRYALPRKYARDKKVDRSANVMYIAGWMLSIAIGVNIGNLANEIIFSNVMGYEINQNNIYKSLISVVIWPILIYAIGYVIAKTISALGKPSRAGVIRTAAPDASAKGLAEQLTQLNELYKQGALSKEQFEAAKVKLLG